MDLNCLLLAAGKGTRLQPLTDSWPKCLMPIHGVPLLDFWLMELLDLKFKNIFVNVSYLAPIVEKYLHRPCLENKIKLIREQELLGTAGTITSIRSYLKKRPTLVIHADNWCGMSMKKFISEYETNRPQNCLITMMTFETDRPENCGIVELDKRNVVQNFYEKDANPPGKIANAAVYILEPCVVEWITKNKSKDISLEVLPNFLGKIFTVFNPSFHRDIGTIKNLKAAQYDPKKHTLTVLDDWINDFMSNPIQKRVTD